MNKKKKKNITRSQKLIERHLLLWFGSLAITERSPDLNKHNHRERTGTSYVRMKKTQTQIKIKPMLIKRFNIITTCLTSYYLFTSYLIRQESMISKFSMVSQACMVSRISWARRLSCLSYFRFASTGRRKFSPPSSYPWPA